MTSIFLTRADRVLLLYWVGSTAVADSWVGVGGHVEPAEIRDPTAAVLREMQEEIGLGRDDVTGLSLRYVALRDTGEELRSTYYFTASLKDTTEEPSECTEGELRWFDLDSPDLARIDMPVTAAVALRHWLSEGRHDQQLRSIVIAAEGPRVLPLTVGQ